MEMAKMGVGEWQPAKRITIFSPFVFLFPTRGSLIIRTMRKRENWKKIPRILGSCVSICVRLCIHEFASENAVLVVHQMLVNKANKRQWEWRERWAITWSMEQGDRDREQRELVETRGGFRNRGTPWRKQHPKPQFDSTVSQRITLVFRPNPLHFWHVLYKY